MIRYISNQLNKVRSFSDKKKQDISAKATTLFLEAILNDIENLENKSICILGSISGMLAVGLGLLNPKIMVIIQDNELENILVSNLQMFKINCDIIVTQKIPFKKKKFDLCFISPSFNNLKNINFNNIKSSLIISNIIYALYPNSLKDKLISNISGIEIYGTVSVSMTPISNYLKNKNNFLVFDILKIKNNS